MFEDHGIVFNRNPEEKEDENIHAKREYTGPEHYITAEERARIANHPVTKMLEGPKKTDTTGTKEKLECMGCGATVLKEDLADHASECREEVDYSQLKPGDRVKIKSWDRMVEEYGVDEYEGIKFTEYYFRKADKRFCGDIVKISEIRIHGFCHSNNNHRIWLDTGCIESIITEPEESEHRKQGIVNIENPPENNDPGYHFLQLADNVYKCHDCGEDVRYAELESHCCKKSVIPEFPTGGIVPPRKQGEIINGFCGSIDIIPNREKLIKVVTEAIIKNQITEDKIYSIIELAAKMTNFGIDPYNVLCDHPIR